jgi:uncharacterized membrane protein (DUF106 family)
MKPARIRAVANAMTHFARYRYWLLLLLVVLQFALLTRAILGPGLPWMFGASGDMLGAATIIAVAIVLTGLAIALAVLYFIHLRSIAEVVAQAQEADRNIARGRLDAEAIRRLRAKTAIPTNA